MSATETAAAVYALGGMATATTLADRLAITQREARARLEALVPTYARCDRGELDTYVLLVDGETIREGLG